MLEKSAQANKENWVRCPNCGHKLLRILSYETPSTVIEVKCHSCKAIVTKKV